MKIGKKKVTPAIAAKWLDKNMPNNRKISAHRVNKLTSDILSGRWKETGDPIKFNMMGMLVDGQHRLSAIIKADVSLELWVAIDVPNDAVKVIDTGRSRSTADLLHINGMGENAFQKASLAKRILTWQKKRAVVIGRGYQSEMTNQDVLEFVALNDLSEYLSFGWKAYSQSVTSTMFSATDWSMLYYIFSEVERKQAATFLMLLSTLDGLSKDHPIRQLFDKINNRQAPLTAMMKLQLTMRTWNAWRKGERTVRLSLTYFRDNEIPELV